jgi:hypothetical protein
MDSDAARGGRPGPGPGRGPGAGPGHVSTHGRGRPVGERLLTLALELAAEGVTGRPAMQALVGAGRLEDVLAARGDCEALAAGGYPHAASALTLLTMATHPSAGAWWGAPKAADRRVPALTRRRQGTCRSARPGTPRRT